MIRLTNLSKTFNTAGTSKVVLDNVNAVFPTGQSVALVGRNGAGKSSLMKIIAGTMAADSGTVSSDGTVSWPVGFAGSFHGELTGAQNIRFIARVYGVDTDELLEFVAQFAELGEHFHMPVRTYSSGMRARLAFGLSMGVDFDTYLVDESTAVGDASFRAKSKEYFLDRLSKSSAIVVSHGMKLLRQICTSGAVLENGKLVYYDNVEDAIAHHEYNMNSSEDDEDEV
ncbi:ABC transporter ATP-binding protein [Tropicimonas isoalkanivorans]|uniref:Capsular polysaccharide transport system ATP-binding protein n=1 Tax=Tropicimonas isoalkanivorans TaxID=441112 RepID=A0A1I1L716_9RHOB|nr:ABC transporter ATP-binding protein [Tropicimonas isoalkanivorans]SFC65360.1 capsular polysaccharide transport system ATP-binding protein [Tropicimonas isoalkanivorans]